MKALENIIFVANDSKPMSIPLANRLLGVSKSKIKTSKLVLISEMKDSDFDNCDACCVLGGDGTILSCVTSVVNRNIPIFGVNLGKLGFLATFQDSITDEDFLDLIGGNYRISERFLIAAKFKDKEIIALNDVIIKQKHTCDMLLSRVYADDEFLADYSSDGLIVSSPTGSTAYNLSAGGPLLRPKSKALILTPICPHTLSNRSIIFDDSSILEIEALTDGNIIVVDGKDYAMMQKGERIRITMSDKTLGFVRNKDHTYFKLLRNKLGWAKNPSA